MSSRATTHPSKATASATATTPLPAEATPIAPAPAAPASPVAAFAPPKPGAGAPTPPGSYDPTTGAVYRGVQPRQAEEAVLDDALKELTGFVNYATTFGKAAPPQAHLVQALQEGVAWSQERQRAEVWLAYCTTNEGVTWSSIRTLLNSFKPQYDAAAAADATIATEHPKLTSLVGAQKAIANKGVATRKANKQARAEGKPEIHGKVGKQRQKRAAKSALQEKSGAAGAAAPAGTTTVAPAGTNGAGANGTAKA